MRTGWSIRSSAVPQSGYVSTVLRFPGVPPAGEGINAGDEVYTMSSPAGGYEPFDWDGTAWSPSEPVIAVGEAFGTYKNQQIGYWKRVLWTWP